MSVQWPERPPESISPFPSPFDGPFAYSNETGSLYNSGSNASGSNASGSNGLDTITRLMQQAEQSSPPGGLMGATWPMNPLSMFQQMGSMFQQLFGGGSPSYGNEQYYANASGGSVGDPHLSFNGSTWNDMSSEPDLLHSDSIHGGYQLSTQTTTPNASGVTYNQSATVTTHNGGTQVTLNNNGDATLTQDGVTTNLQPGQTLQLGNETVARDANGSVQVTCNNQNGGQIATTMSSNGPGVDVNVSANNVDLGGAMTNSSNASGSTQPGRPVMHRYEDHPMQSG
jgi:hypothetical protein